MTPAHKPEERRKWFLNRDFHGGLCAGDEPDDQYGESIPVIEHRPGDVILSREEAEEMKRLLDYGLYSGAYAILEAAMKGTGK